MRPVWRRDHGTRAHTPASRGRSQVDGRQLWQMYTALGLRLDTADNAVEASIYRLSEEFNSWRLKVFKSLPQLAVGIAAVAAAREGVPGAAHQHNGRQRCGRRSSGNRASGCCAQLYYAFTTSGRR